MEKQYDAIIVGARCAGAPTAMLLARKGYRVLLVDRARFPSDTVSTHVVQPMGVAALQRWGLLDALIATGCPPVHTYAFDFGPFTISGSPGTAAAPVAYCPRRTILDKLLVDAAVAAGVELREDFAVSELLADQGVVTGIRGRARGGLTAGERAAVVIGADGRNSMVAGAVRAQPYEEKPPLLVAYYTYWSGLPMKGRFETYIRPSRGFAAIETHDGLTMVVAGWPYAELETQRENIEASYLNVLALAPPFAERLSSARREARFAGAALPNFFRKPYGPGWALVGDAGYNKDAITAQGISDAFRDAELCSTALDQAFTGSRSFEEAMAWYQHTRDQKSLPMYELTCQLATLDPPPPQMQELLGAIHGNQAAMDGFVKMNAGTISPAEFLAPENIGSILSAATPRSPDATAGPA
jgi:2-polyprenyl-6-methoxyphenol hydroxylase-like FAD-dependent oxidoreductase